MSMLLSTFQISWEEQMSQSYMSPYPRGNLGGCVPPAQSPSNARVLGMMVLLALYLPWTYIEDLLCTASKANFPIGKVLLMGTNSSQVRAFRPWEALNAFLLLWYLYFLRDVLPVLTFSGDQAGSSQPGSAVTVCPVLVRSGVAESQTLVWLIGPGPEPWGKRPLVPHEGGDSVPGPGRTPPPLWWRLAGR